MTIIHWAHEDFYEINYTDKGVTSIVRYRRGMTVRGQEIDYDLLSPHIQLGIHEKLKKALQNHDSSNKANHGDSPKRTPKDGEGTISDSGRSSG